MTGLHGQWRVALRVARLQAAFRFIFTLPVQSVTAIIMWVIWNVCCEMSAWAPDSQSSIRGRAGRNGSLRARRVHECKAQRYVPGVASSPCSVVAKSARHAIASSEQLQRLQVVGFYGISSGQLLSPHSFAVKPSSFLLPVSPDFERPCLTGRPNIGDVPPCESAQDARLIFLERNLSPFLELFRLILKHVAHVCISVSCLRRGEV